MKNETTTSPPVPTELAAVNSLAFKSEVLESTLPVMVDVSSPWCAPCKAAEPVMKRIAQTYAGRLKVLKLDGSENPETAAEYRVLGFPTFLGFRDGRLVASSSGFSRAATLQSFAERLLSEDG